MPSPPMIFAVEEDVAGRKKWKKRATVRHDAGASIMPFLAPNRHEHVMGDWYIVGYPKKTCDACHADVSECDIISPRHELTNS